MDGFHYPNAYLAAHCDSCGRPLAERKGAPDTFDAAAFAQRVARLGAEPHVPWPRYCRRLHEPQEGPPVGAGCTPALVEGNYLLYDEGPWARVRERLDLAVHIDVPLSVAREALVRRFVEGGRREREARARYDRVDRINYETATAAAWRADLVLRRDESFRLVDLAPPAGLGMEPRE
jgi:pantothenate kinase